MIALASNRDPALRKFVTIIHTPSMMSSQGVDRFAWTAHPGGGDPRSPSLTSPTPSVTICAYLPRSCCGFRW
ncbi:hypothetical protein GCM10009793_21760 [Brachybacterium phenoliresistens]